MTSTRERKGVVEWAVMVLPIVVLTIGVIVSFTRLEDRVTSACSTFDERISGIKENGTKVSAESATKIVRLEEKFSSIDQRLVRIEDAQTKMIENQMALIRTLKQERQNTSP